MKTRSPKFVLIIQLEPNLIVKMGNKRVIWCDADTLSKDVSGKIYIVTGANSGVGLETTRQLIKQGGQVVMACRRVSAGEEEAKAFSSFELSESVKSRLINSKFGELEQGKALTFAVRLIAADN